ncbi:MAG: DUF2147 domain-containing protein [Bacteroidia bacterium]|nr:DUF2147 domain-containing protein [Bacteroidia bacterium]MBP9689673.1 DUF2147 domain-containing protein [Bacteroidia bacterium]
MKKLIIFIVLNVSTFLASTQEIMQADAILGIWQTGKGNARVQIKKAGTMYYGQIVWLKTPNYEDGKPKVDKNNPDASKRNTPLLGLRMLLGFKYIGDKTWEDGTIYDPESGKTYSCKMELINENSLNVRGFYGFSFIGRTDTWTRIK